MSSENLGLVAFGVVLFSVNAFLGAPIASKIAGFFTRVLPAGTGGASKVGQAGHPKMDEGQSVRLRNQV